MTRRNAALLTVGLGLLAYTAVVVAASDRLFPPPGTAPGREQRAVVAIRDNVTPFQKWGTELFTWYCLNRHYGAVWYFTQSKRGDQEEEFVACLNQALERYPRVDLFLLAHTNNYLNWVARLPQERRKRLGFVYNTGCYNLPQGPDWLKLGAKTYVGHPGQSSSEVFYYFFLRRWAHGYPIERAMHESNARMERFFRRLQFFTLGRVDAGWLYKESKAACYGNAQAWMGGAE